MPRIMLANADMPIIKYSSLFFAGVVLFVSVFAKAEDKDKASWTPKLMIEPSICVLENPDDHCNRLITLKFNQKIGQEFCVYVVANDSKRQCYLPHQANEFTYAINTKQTVMIVIEDKVERKVIAKAILKISKYLPVNKRKRRRYGWNLL